MHPARKARAESRLPSPGADLYVLANKGAGSRTTSYEAFPFEVPLSLQHSIRVDGQLGDNLSDRWELITGLNVPQPQGMAHLLYELQVSCHPSAAVKTEFDHCLI